MYLSQLFIVALFVVTTLGGHASLSADYSLDWSISSDVLTVDITVNKLSWVAIGFHPVGSTDSGMNLADAIIATFDGSGSGTVNDYYSKTFQMPDLDTDLGGQDNILSYTASQVDGKTTVHFTRKLNTGDTYDVPITVGPFKAIWAIGNSNTFEYHGYGPNSRGSQILDFFDDDVCGKSVGCKDCNSHSNCIFCGNDGLCYDKSNTGACPVLNSTCTSSCDNALPNAWVPDGYCASRWLTGLGTPRGLAVASNGDILVVEAARNQITVVWEDNDVVSRAKLASASGLNHGVAISAPYVYASSPTTVYRWKYSPGDRTDLGTPETVIVGVPCCHHVTRTLIFDAQGDLYVSCGSGSNVDPNSSHSRIMRFSVANIPTGGLNWTTGLLFADGLRNEVGLSFDAQDRLWGVENGVDDLFRSDLGGDIHINNPSEEVNLFDVPSKFYGYPYCWTEYDLPTYGKGRGSQWVHNNFMKDGVHSDAWCSDTNNVVKPKWSMSAHQAPLDIQFYYGTQLPSFPPGGAFVCLHGSWDRQPPAGYKVIYLNFDGGVPVGEVDVLKYNGNGAPWPNSVRPVNVVVKACGDGKECLYVTSDDSGEIIQISYTG